MLSPLARKILSGITPYTPGKPVEEVQRELGLASAIKLASNENPLGPSPKALEAIQKTLPNLHRYPDSNCFYLARKLAAHMQVSPEQILVGNGSDELITLAARAFIEPGDEVVIAEPTFLIYRIAAQLAGAKIRVVALRDFRYNLEGMRRAVNSRTKLVFIANPDNPTGSYVTRAEVEDFMAGLPPQAIVFFDEAYAELVDAPDYPDTRAYLGRHPVILTRTFSKAYGLGGLRIGYGIAAPELIEALQRVREPFNVNALAQAAAIAALDDTAHLEATRRLLREEKKVLYRAFETLGLEAVPSAANFILFRLGPRAGEQVQALLRRGIIVRHMQAWGLPQFVRVTIGRPEENQAFIQALQDVLKGEKRS